MKDRNGNILKIGNKLKNKKGDIGTIQNIGGVTMLIHKHENGEIKQSIVFNKVDLSQMELVA